jgi:hypothetical protein
MICIFPFLVGVKGLCFVHARVWISMHWIKDFLHKLVRNMMYLFLLVAI